MYLLKELDGEPKPPSLADFVQQLLHLNNCKIDPCGIEVEGIDNIYAPVIIRHLSIGITIVIV